MRNSGFRAAFTSAMRYLFALIIASYSYLDIKSQDIIATSRHPYATANHNQRKVLRDSEENIYIVFSDSLNKTFVVRGLYYDRSTLTWSGSGIISEGTEPNLAIGREDRIFLVYRSNDSISKIKMKCSEDFVSWSEEHIISDTSRNCYLPVADCDSSGSLNVFWIQNNGNGTNSLVFCQVKDEKVAGFKTIATKNQLIDISIANHLLYHNNVLYFAYHFGPDSVIFCRSEDYLESIDTVYSTTGSQPGLTYNSFQPDWHDLGQVRMQFLDLDHNLLEREQEESVECCFEDVVLHPGHIDYVCIDDLALPLGYSYLFVKHDTLYHASSCGRYAYRKVLDTIPNHPLFPSIAYKQFNIAYIDFIWMERTDSNFNILYKRDNKLQYIGGTDNETGKGFSITGFPNPFSDCLNISVEVESDQYEPFIDIYNTESRLVQRLNPDARIGNKYNFTWMPIGSKTDIPPGIYFIRCTVGHKGMGKIVIKTD